MRNGKSIALLLTGVVLGAALVGPASAAVEALTATRSGQPIYVDGKRVTMEAYSINGSNYVKLRDAGEAVGFNVYWDGSAVQVQSGAAYTGEAPAQSAVQNTADIIAAKAKQIALADAGLKEADVTFSPVTTGTEQGTRVYEVEFFSGTMEYEYDIAIASGKIIGSSKEPRGTQSVPVGQTGAAQSGTDVGKDAAIAAALKHAGLTKDGVTRLTAKLDTEDGRRIYEVEFHVGRTEYSYEIDAGSGTVLDWEKETD